MDAQIQSDMTATTNHLPLEVVFGVARRRCTWRLSGRCLWLRTSVMHDLTNRTREELYLVEVDGI
jgi:hypothetical protein